jgi:uncharacterized membrane protein YfcA
MSMRNISKYRLSYIVVVTLLVITFGDKLHDFRAAHPGVLSATSWSILCLLATALFFWAKAWSKDAQHRRGQLVATVATIGIAVGGFMCFQHLDDVSYLVLLVVIFAIIIAVYYEAPRLLHYMGYFDNGNLPAPEQLPGSVEEQPAALHCVPSAPSHEPGAYFDQVLSGDQLFDDH